MSQLSKENYEAMVSILADHNASDELAGALANYFEKDNPLFKRELFLRKFFLKREVSQQLDKAHKHLNLRFTIMWYYIQMKRDCLFYLP